jgi:hypothetical protein
VGRFGEAYMAPGNPFLVVVEVSLGEVGKALMAPGWLLLALLDFSWLAKG